MTKKLFAGIFALIVLFTVTAGAVAAPSAAFASSDSAAAAAAADTVGKYYLTVNLSAPVGYDASNNYIGEYPYKFKHNFKGAERIFSMSDYRNAQWRIVSGQSEKTATLPVNVHMFLDDDAGEVVTVPVWATATPRIGRGMPYTAGYGTFWDFVLPPLSGEGECYAKLSDVQLEIDKYTYDKIKSTQSNTLQITLAIEVNRQSGYMITNDMGYIDEAQNGQGRMIFDISLSTTVQDDIYSESTQDYWENQWQKWKDALASDNEDLSVWERFLTFVENIAGSGAVEIVQKIATIFIIICAVIMVAIAIGILTRIITFVVKLYR